ncbi:MAG: hypothetical protein ABR588_00570 [Sphingomicrobium sp.]|nr:hypothetical protein [Sphingomonadales bacterium]
MHPQIEAGMHLNKMICSIVCAAAIYQPVAARAATTPLPVWVTKLISTQPARSSTVIEEATYRRHRVFVLMPSDRAPDSGNEHVLHSQDGRIICEFGGIAGHVTVGSCDIEQIKFVRTLYPQRSRMLKRR